MSLLSNLIDAKIFVQLDAHEFERLEAALNSEVVTDPRIQAILKEKVETFLPYLKTGH